MKTKLYDTAFKLSSDNTCTDEYIDDNISSSQNLPDSFSLSKFTKHGLITFKAKRHMESDPVAVYYNAFVYFKKHGGKNHLRVGSIDFMYIYPSEAVSLEDLYWCVENWCTDVWEFLERVIDRNFYADDFPQIENFGDSHQWLSACNDFITRPFIRNEILPPEEQNHTVSKRPILYIVKSLVLEKWRGHGFIQEAMKLLLTDSRKACSAAGLNAYPIKVSHSGDEIPLNKLVQVYENMQFKQYDRKLDEISVFMIMRMSEFTKNTGMESTL